MKTNVLEDLLKDGFAEKYARFYLDAINREKDCPAYDKKYMDWAHSNGFLAEYAYAYQLNESNYKSYLSDYDFYKMWPLNSWARIWVNDKLTLKLMLTGTEYEYLLPKYYFYSMPNGLRPLSDCHLRTGEPLNDFVELLRAEGVFACKPNNDTMSKGFFRLSYREGSFFINNDKCSDTDIKNFVLGHPNYVFQEYIKAGGVYGEITPLIHTLRVLVLNENGISPKIVRSYSRFPCKWSGEANYIALDGVNTDVYTIYADVNVDTGKWGDALLIYANKVVKALVHPDSGKVLNGCIENFDELKHLILGMADRFNACEYMGFDIGITDKGFRLMEINTHPEIRGFQCFRSMLDNDLLKDYYSRRIAKIDSLTDDQKRARNGIPR